MVNSLRRIIPTCVGKRDWGVIFWVTPPDHPHVRGEKSASSNT